jgi:hypothetical protein
MKIEKLSINLEDAMDAALVLITLVLIRLVLPFTALILIGTLVNRRQVKLVR